jgi:hypothetical protein
MSDTHSLILKDQEKAAQQPFLFDDENLVIDRTRPKYHCTGERLHRVDPERYAAVVKALADPGLTIKTICETLHVSEECLRAVKAREKIPINEEKLILLGNITHGLRLATERTIETMPNASTKDAVLAVGILTDRMQVLTGEATAIVEHREPRDIFKEYEDMLRSVGAHPDQANEIPSSSHQHSPGYKGFIKHLEHLENGEETALPSSLPYKRGLEKPAQAKVIESSRKDSSRENDPNEKFFSEGTGSE